MPVPALQLMQGLTLLVPQILALMMLLLVIAASDQLRHSLGGSQFRVASSKASLAGRTGSPRQGQKRHGRLGRSSLSSSRTECPPSLNSSPWLSHMPDLRLHGGTATFLPGGSAIKVIHVPHVSLKPVSGSSATRYLLGLSFARVGISTRGAVTAQTAKLVWTGGCTVAT